jgi:hypothetical protein
MTRRTSGAPQSPEHGVTFVEVGQEALTKEQFNKDLEHNVALMLSQEPYGSETNDIGTEEGGEKGRAGEATGGEGEDDDDDDDEGAYESLEDPFPPEVRHKLTEDDLDKDFDPNEEV